MELAGGGSKGAIEAVGERGCAAEVEDDASWATIGEASGDIGTTSSYLSLVEGHGSLGKEEVCPM